MEGAGRLPIDEQLQHFRAALETNKTLVEVLTRAASLDLPGWYLAAGALSQTVWNAITRQPPETGIDDYDLIYFDDADLSYEAEDAVITAAARLFSDLPHVRVEVRNQARVHLWYAAKFGVACAPRTSSEMAIDAWVSSTALFGVRLLADGQWKVYAPWGFSDLFNLIVRPNTVLGNRAAYEKKAQRWKSIWPTLQVLPWPENAGDPSQLLGHGTQ